LPSQTSKNVTLKRFDWFDLYNAISSLIYN
jgi:hypothetical protein